MAGLVAFSYQAAPVTVKGDHRRLHDVCSLPETCLSIAGHPRRTIGRYGGPGHVHWIRPPEHGSIGLGLQSRIGGLDVVLGDGIAGLATELNGVCCECSRWIYNARRT